MVPALIVGAVVVVALLSAQRAPGVPQEAIDGLDPRAAAALAELLRQIEAAGLPPVVITSGRRTVEAQARAMLDKWRAAGGGPAGADELRSIYRRGSGPATVELLLQAPPDVDAWAAVLRERPPVSAHQAGRAVDLRVWSGVPGSSPMRPDLDQLQAIARAAGWRPLLESKPPHLHLELAS